MRNDTKTITITDLADVQPGDMVTAEYVPHPIVGDFGATIIGQASAAYGGGLIIGGHDLRVGEGAAYAALRFISATREVPAWEPGEDEVRCLAQSLAAAIGAPASDWVSWRADATHLLTHMHDNGWRKDDPTESAPVDPVLDETDKRDRIDSDGDRWQWSEGNATWISDDDYAMGSLAALGRHYGPLRFADEETES